MTTLRVFVASGAPLKKQSLALVGEDVLLDSVTSIATGVNREDGLASDIMSPRVVRLPQQRDKDPVTNLLDIALRKYVYIFRLFLQEVRLLQSTMGSFSRQTFLLPTNFITCKDRLGIQVLTTTSSQKKLG